MPFNIIRTPGQSSIVSDQTDDILDIVAGPGIAITTNASIDTITITATGGGGSGFAGSSGYTGSLGGLGYTGSEGTLGYTGSKGNTGGLGDIGYSGSTGTTGFTGSQGDTGFTGSASTVIGFTGSLGATGDVGFTGSAAFNYSQDTGEPTGFLDRADSTIAFNTATREFSIAPVSGSYDIYTVGVKRNISTTNTVTIPNVTDLYYIYFDSAGVLQYKTTFFDWPVDCMVAYVYWNATEGSAPFVADERHGITMDWATHEYLHRTRGAAIASGFEVSNYSITGTGNANLDAQLDIANGTFFDEDLEVFISHSLTPAVNAFQQHLQGAARIPMMYLNIADWVMDTPTAFPLKQGTNRPRFNEFAGASWTTTDIDSNKYGITYIIATNNITYPVIGIIGQTSYNTIGTAQDATFDSLDLTGFPVVEFRPLYKVIYEVKNTYTNSVRAKFVAVQDLRSISAVSAISVNPSGVGYTGSTGYTGSAAIGGIDSEIVNGNSNVTVDANSAVRVAVNGTSNVITIDSSNTFITGNLIPSQSNTFSLGTPDLRWKDLYVSANSVSIGDIVNSVTLSATNTGQLQILQDQAGTITPTLLDSAVTVIITCTGKNKVVTVESDVVDFRMPRKIKVTEVRASVSTAQASGSRLTMDIKKNGVSILSTLLSFDNTEKTTKTSSVPCVITPNTIIDDDDEVSVDVTQVGNGTAKGLKVQITGLSVN